MFVSAENEEDITKSQGDLLNTYTGMFPMGTWIDFTNRAQYLHGKWVTIVDESREPITLSEVRVYGSK